MDFPPRIEFVIQLARAYGEAAGLAKATDDAYFATARDGSASALESTAAAERAAFKALVEALRSVDPHGLMTLVEAYGEACRAYERAPVAEARLTMDLAADSVFKAIFKTEKG